MATKNQLHTPNCWWIESGGRCSCGAAHTEKPAHNKVEVISPHEIRPTNHEMARSSFGEFNTVNSLPPLTEEQEEEYLAWALIKWGDYGPYGYGPDDYGLDTSEGFDDNES